mgnify:FL=1
MMSGPPPEMRAPQEPEVDWRRQWEFLRAVRGMARAALEALSEAPLAAYREVIDSSPSAPAQPSGPHVEWQRATDALCAWLSGALKSGDALAIALDEAMDGAWHSSS